MEEEDEFDAKNIDLNKNHKDEELILNKEK